ncbi:MAG: histidine--tRNA ligase [Oscillospiraceae bacterium]|jgi:histidyl-tRNA synthetase|nr:histidine--tRNA ligase [Oscillospiraceae bacterium]
MKISAPRGTYDLLPEDTRKWQALEAELRSVAALFGYGEIRFPMFEHTELFLRGMGETGDVVQKEMYTFLDKDGRSLTLRPEGTASAARAFIEHGLHMSALPFKCFYIAPCFRYEKPQKGRYRQHVQFGVECFGAPEPQADAEVIALAHTIIERLGLANIKLHLNSIGCNKCRPAFQQTLRSWLDERAPQLCETCRARLERNPMRVLDCKEEACARLSEDAPVITNNICLDCASFKEKVETLLEGMGIPFVRNPRIMRGFDYYTGTVFEFISNDIGAQGTVFGGGRYDGLVEELGGPRVPALGFGMGLERLLLAGGANGREPLVNDIYVAPLGRDMTAFCVKLCLELRRLGVAAETDLCGRSLKAQMKYADKTGATFTAVVGGDELAKGEVLLKDMRSGETASCSLDAETIAKTMTIILEVDEA